MKNRFSFRLLVLLTAMLSGMPLHAEPCAEPLSANKVSGVDQCLLYRAFGSETPESLIVWLHGDTSSGGPANSHFKIAEKATEELGKEKIKSVALVRPGYPDGSGEESSVAFGHGGRRDSYTDRNIGEVIGAIERLKARYQPKRTVLVGHSGGAAISAVIIGMSPATAAAVVLVACACDTSVWRWSRSENPMQWVGKVEPPVRVVALTGDRDSTTLPVLAERYVELLQKRGIDAKFRLIPEVDHNGAFRSPEVTATLQELLAETPRNTR